MILERLPWSAVARDPAAAERFAEIASLHAARSLVMRAADLAVEVARATPRRADIAQLLVRAATDARAPHASVQSASRLADPKSVAVITGQQPGFLGGPLFTLFKAAHAIAFARALEREHGVPAVALFWNHSDDHDLDETRGVVLADGRGEARRFTLDLGRGRPFLSDVLVPADALEIYARVAELLPAGPDRARVVDLFRPTPGGRFAADTTRLLLDLLGGEGLVVFEPRDLRPLFTAPLAHVVRSTEGSLARLSATANATRSRGRTPALDPADPSLLFVRTPRGRERVHWRDGAFALPDGTRATPDALARAIESRPDDFSAGVACRLVVEALALPVVASIRGPGELAYAPEARCFFPEGARPAPIEVPRFSATLVEPRAAASLAAARLSLGDLLRPADSPAPSRVEPALDHPSTRAIADLQADVRARLESLAPALRALDPNLTRPFEKTLASASRSLEALRSKIAHTLEDRADVGEARRLRLAGALAPFGLPQERAVPSAPFLCAGIQHRVAEILAAVDLVPSGHVALALDAGAPGPSNPN